MILIPAYGSDYKTAAEVRKHWEAGKDFRIMDISMGRWDGSYINNPQFDKDVTEPQRRGSYIRYNKLQNLIHIGQWEEKEEE